MNEEDRQMRCVGSLLEEARMRECSSQMNVQEQRGEEGCLGKQREKGQ